MLDSQQDLILAEENMNNIPQAVQHGVLILLEKRYSGKVFKHTFSSVYGGCINHGGKLTTSQGIFFVKWNNAGKFPGMFEAEANGLRLLKVQEAINNPSVIDHGESETFQFIILEFIEDSSPSETFWNDLGVSLAKLHRCTNPYFGLDHHNYMGSLRQFNDQAASWINFFIGHRLQPQLKLAVDSHLADRQIITKFEKLFKELPSILTDEKPSLLHGDLWNGNLIVNKGAPCLIDPAVYYGHRESDLAMTRLFGGFADEFFEIYHEAFPLNPGYSNRFDIYNLYPLLVHVNLFGRSYLTQVGSILNAFV